MPIPLNRSEAMRMPDPALQGRWLVVLPDVGDGVSKLFVETIQTTFYKTPAKSRGQQGSNSYYPDLADIDGLTMTVYEDHLHSAARALQKWANLIYDADTGYYGLPVNYKKDVIVFHYGLENTSTPLLTETYKGCWPTDRMRNEQNYSEIDGRLTLNITLSADSKSLAG
jgi:hypothetical protein